MIVSTKLHLKSRFVQNLCLNLTCVIEAEELPTPVRYRDNPCKQLDDVRRKCLKPDS